jgi:hypothetical protein
VNNPPREPTFWTEKHGEDWFIMYQPLNEKPRHTWPKPVRLFKYNLDDVDEMVKQHACTVLAAVLDAHDVKRNDA